MKRKILSFVVYGKKILALYSESHPEHGEGGWFVVTGGVENSESYEEAVAREIKEETKLDVQDILDLNWGSIYNWKNDVCEEHNFISFVKPGKIILNEEHSKYEWLNIEEFIKRIRWDDDKEILMKVLEQALNKKLYFKTRSFKDYRK